MCELFCASAVPKCEKFAYNSNTSECLKISTCSGTSYDKDFDIFELADATVTEGNYSKHTASSPSECASMCNQSISCVAFEYNAPTGTDNCEIHYSPIIRTTYGDVTSPSKCYTKLSDGPPPDEWILLGENVCYGARNSSCVPPPRPFALFCFHREGRSQIFVHNRKSNGL